MPQTEQHEERTEVVKDILTKVPHWIILWGNSVLFALIILALFLTYLIKYPDVIPAQAIVTTKTPPQKEYANLNGTIDTLLVPNHSLVRKGQILAMYENTARLEDVLKLKELIERDSLEQDGYDFFFSSGNILSLGEIGPAYASLERDYLSYRLHKKLQPYQNKINTSENSITELLRRLENFKSQKENGEKTYEYLQKDFLRNEALYNKGVIAQQEYEAKKINLLQARNNLENLEVSISQLQQSVLEATNHRKDTQIDLTIEDITLQKNYLLSLNNLRRVIKDWELKYLLKSEMAGEVSFVNIWNEHQEVKQGILLFTVIPTGQQQHLAKVFAPVNNSGKIEVGQDINISLYDYPETEYGVLKAEVQSMSDLPNAEGAYIIDAKLKNGLTTTYKKKVPFRSEMNGGAEIITEDLRIIERLFYQLRNLFDS